MTDDDPTSNLPAPIANAVSSVPKALIPASLKALDRLIGAAVDIPVAWLSQKKAKLDSQTQSFTLVERAVAKAVATEAGTNEETVKRALDVLVRKEYRKQTNREAIAVAMLEDLRSEEPDKEEISETSPAEVNDDWLNVFERYAEDASTERMQNLWGRVMAGEVRKPGRYSMRTLRFLSEFSQADALTFEDFCGSAFGEMAPTKLVKPENQTDIRSLIYLESSGLIQGASGFGLEQTLTLNGNGLGFLIEGKLALVLQGKPSEKIVIQCCVLTPLGQELLSLLPGRNVRDSGRKVGLAIREDKIESAYLATVVNPQQVRPLEILWQKDASEPAASN